MNARDRSTQAPAGLHVSTLNTSDRRLAGPWLLTARIGWGTTALLSLLLFAFSVPAYFAGLHVVCPTENTVACHIGRITRGNAMALTHLNISVDIYATYILAITLFASAIFLAVGAIIFWRKSKRRLDSSPPSCLSPGAVVVPPQNCLKRLQQRTRPRGCFRSSTKWPSFSILPLGCSLVSFQWTLCAALVLAAYWTVVLHGVLLRLPNLLTFLCRKFASYLLGSRAPALSGH